MTGTLGAAGIALLALSRKIPASIEIMNALYEPFPRITEGIALARSRAVTSMMDISDGLAMSLHDLGKAGNVGFKIYESRLPVLSNVDGFIHEELLDAAIFSGGDFVLLFTVDPDMLQCAKEACHLTVIGEVIQEGFFIDRYGRADKLEARGYEHFGNKD